MKTLNRTWYSVLTFILTVAGFSDSTAALGSTECYPKDITSKATVYALLNSKSYRITEDSLLGQLLDGKRELRDLNDLELDTLQKELAAVSILVERESSGHVI